MLTSRTHPADRRRCSIGVLEKAVVVEWHAQVPHQDGDVGKKVCDAAAPFVAWLALDEASSADEVDAVGRSLSLAAIEPCATSTDGVSTATLDALD